MMKKILLLLLIFNFSCKNEAKKKEGIVKEPVKEEQTKLVLNELSLPEMSKWGKNRISLVKTENSSGLGDEYLMSRLSATQSAFILISNIKVFEGGTYRASILVKRENTSNHFGLRMVGEYPNRVDAVFNLTNGKADFKQTGYFENSKTMINDLGNGWYKCSLVSDIYTNNIKFAFGPTNSARAIESWEGSIKEGITAYIIPSSVKMEELKE